jgi:hypothetical protein
VNKEHLRICANSEWVSFVGNELLAWALGGLDLKDEVLEVRELAGLEV